MARARELLRTDTGRAATLTAAAMAANVIALVFTVVFSHLLGNGYGSLVALLAAFLILAVPGQALQATVAREISRAEAAGEPDPLANVWRWLRSLSLATVAATVLSVAVTALAPGRGPIAAAIGVDEAWAAASVLPSACVWLLLCVERGALQGVRRYGLVGISLIAEAASRLGLGLALYGAGAGVTGAFLGTGAAVLVMALALAPVLAAHHGPHADHGGLRALLALAPAPLVALALLAVLQNVDVIVVQHVADTRAQSSSYAAAAIAAKAVVWVAVGIGLSLLPEAVRRTQSGLDARPVLLRSLGLIVATALPMVALYAVAGEPFLRAVFGADRTHASGALPWLGAAMTMLALAYLGAQYLLALHDNRFLVLLAVAAVAQPLMLLAIGPRLTTIAVALLALLGALAAAVLAISFRDAGRRLATGGPPP